jgi:hypothetical protein
MGEAGQTEREPEAKRARKREEEEETEEKEEEEAEEKEEEEIAERIERRFREVQRNIKLDEAVSAKAAQVAETSRMEEIIQHRRQVEAAAAALGDAPDDAKLAAKVQLELRVWSAAYDMQV